MCAESARQSAEARRIVLSYPENLAPHGKRRVQQEYYKTYLRKVKDAATVGDTWDEFTDVGCCGCQMDVPLRVERVDGGSNITQATAIEYTTREAMPVNPGWSVQNDELPK